jgi:acetyl-CoA carboxylase carboxyltransferase component
MGPKGAAKILYRSKLSDPPRSPSALRSTRTASNPFIAAERGYIDEVILTLHCTPKVLASTHLMRYHLTEIAALFVDLC